MNLFRRAVLPALLFAPLLCMMLIGVPMHAIATTVTVQSDHLDIWENKQEALFTGKVHLVREDFELYCDSLRAFYLTGSAGSGIDHALATGNVRMIQGDKLGTSDSAVIDNRKQIVTLRGNAEMVQEGGRVSGETIVHDLSARTTEVTQGKNGRVSLRIDEKTMDVTPAKDDGSTQAEPSGNEPSENEPPMDEQVLDVPLPDGQAEGNKPADIDAGEQQP
ncbi:MAG: LptA/OstA family protein [Mariprofundaceae bacterium]|nr:LptA/OstA family protein [Mariprofundaceae bacterium]